MKILENAEHHITLESECDTFVFDIRWDGCIHVWNYSNGVRHSDPDSDFKRENTDYMHICRGTDFIAELKEAMHAARQRGFSVDK